MIPYDDLVAALSSWRARQGLPVSTMGGGTGPVAATPGSGPTPTPGSGPTAKPGSGPNRGAPPPAPPRAKAASIPPPLEEPLDVEDAALLDEEQAYEPEGSDFAMSFGQKAVADGDDSTAISGAPERPSEPTDPVGARGGGNPDKDDW